MAKVLVTGAGGFIGSHLTEELVRQGEEVRAFVRYNSRDDRGLLEELPGEIRNQLEVVRGDLKDPEGCQKSRERMQSKSFTWGHSSPSHIPMFIPSTLCRQTLLALRTFSMPALRMRAWRRSSTPPPVKSTEQPLTLPSTRNIRCKPNLPIRPARLPPTNWRRATIFPLTSPSPRFVPSTPSARDSPFGRSSPRSFLRPSKVRELNLGNTAPRRDFLFVRDTVRGFIALGKCEEAVGKAVNVGVGQDISIGDVMKKIVGLFGKEGEIHD